MVTQQDRTLYVSLEEAGQRTTFETWHMEAKKHGCKDSEMAAMKPIFEDRLHAL